MNSSQNTVQNKEGVIAITEKQRFEDGSVELEYTLNFDALDACAKEYDKETKDLTDEEIHEFVQINLGLAVKCHDGWKAVKN